MCKVAISFWKLSARCNLQGLGQSDVLYHSFTLVWAMYTNSKRISIVQRVPSSATLRSPYQSFNKHVCQLGSSAPPKPKGLNDAVNLKEPINVFVIISITIHSLASSHFRVALAVDGVSCNLVAYCDSVASP